LCRNSSARTARWRLRIRRPLVREVVGRCRRQLPSTHVRCLCTRNFLAVAHSFCYIEPPVILQANFGARKSRTNGVCPALRVPPAAAAEIHEQCCVALSGAKRAVRSPRLRSGRLPSADGLWRVWDGRLFPQSEHVETPPPCRVLVSARRRAASPRGRGRKAVRPSRSQQVSGDPHSRIV